MSRILEHFNALKSKNRVALAPYIMAGYPDLATSFSLMKAAVDAGADLIELGMPFSDPLADGATVQKAGQVALKNPFSLRQLLMEFKTRGQSLGIPVVIMSYYNPVYQLGLERTSQLAAEAGIAGFIVPDLPLEESGPFQNQLIAHGLDLVPLVAPTSSPERIREIDSKTTGMLYYVSHQELLCQPLALTQGQCEWRGSGIGHAKKFVQSRHHVLKLRVFAKILHQIKDDIRRILEEGKEAVKIVIHVQEGDLVARTLQSLLDFLVFLKHRRNMNIVFGFESERVRVNLLQLFVLVLTHMVEHECNGNRWFRHCTE